MKLLERFERWLEQEGYAATSILKIRRDVALMAEHGPHPRRAQGARRKDALRWAWRAWADFCTAEGIDNVLLEPAVAEGRRRRLRGAKRLRPAESIESTEWHRLLALVESDARIEARVIDVQCSTALRVGDVLRSSRAAIEHGLAREDGIAQLEVKGSKPVVVCVRGGPEREWRRLAEALSELAPSALVCEAVSPHSGPDWTANGAAYRQIDRYLKKLGERAGVSGRLHTHRLRRTVAIQASLAGVPKFKIQKLLQHESDGTTSLYLDEAMAREAAEIARIVRRR